METVILAVEPREARGKGGAHKLRRAGSIPAVLYGKGRETAALSVSETALRDALAKGRHSVLAIETGGKTEYAVIKQIQQHPVRHQILHLDLLAVDLAVETELAVPVELVGESAGVRSGGILDQLTREVTVRGLPREIPSSVQADISALEVGDHVNVKDLRVPPGVTVLDDPEALVASILAPPTGLEGAGVEEGTQPEEITEAPEEE
jgi:large subunit ribosomal protein L25